MSVLKEVGAVVCMGVRTHLHHVLAFARWGLCWGTTVPKLLEILGYGLVGQDTQGLISDPYHVAFFFLSFFLSCSLRWV